MKSLWSSKKINATVSHLESIDDCYKRPIHLKFEMRVAVGLCMFWASSFLVVESHPDNAHEDLRLDRPFQALEDFCNTLNLETMNKKVS